MRDIPDGGPNALWKPALGDMGGVRSLMSRRPVNDVVAADRGEGIDQALDVKIPIWHEGTDEWWQSTDWLVIHQHQGNTHMWIEPNSYTVSRPEG